MNVGVGRVVTETMSGQVLQSLGAEHVDHLVTNFFRLMDNGVTASNFRTMAGGFESLPPKHIVQFDVTGPGAAIEASRSGVRHLLDGMYETVPQSLQHLIA